MKQNQGAFSTLNSVQLMVMVLLTLSACTGVAPEQKQTSAVPATESVALPEADAEEIVGPTGLEMPLDGSSLEAFDQSLAKVKKTSSETEYAALEKAIDYLLLYDIGANADREKLAKRLDGMTGQEVMEKVNWRKY